MDGVVIPFIPAGAWLFASSFLLLLLLVMFGYHVYQRSRVRALTGDSENIAELAARKELLQADVVALREWIEGQKGELSLLEGERHQQEIVRAELTQSEQALALKRQELDDWVSKAGELEQQMYLKRQALDELEQKIGNFEAKKAEVVALNRQLEELHREVENVKVQAGKTAELETKHAALSVQAYLLEQDIAAHKQALDPLRDEKIQTQEWLAKERQALAIERETRTTLQQEVNELTARKEALTVELDKLQDELEKSQNDREQNWTELKQLERSLEAKYRESQKLASETGDLKYRLELKRQDLNELELVTNKLTARKEALTVELDKLRGELGGTVSGSGQDDPYADLLQKEPTCMARNEFSAPAKERDESALLREFRDTLRHEGYFFSERIIDAFHTSLKCHDINPLTVLAGVSGTGKTLLPIRYAEFMGMHRLVMAVQPRWDSPQDMFGFYNYMEKKYKASELSRALVRMDPYNYQGDFKGGEWAHERMLLVLLDEMNLARTEYYFSEFLSKLELRRMVEDPSNQVKRSQAELDLDAGPGARPFKVWVPNNIFFVGTMNEDETTQTLSDKVLDRANVLRFGKPDEKTGQAASYSEPSTRKSFLPYATWKNWIRSPRESDWQKDVNRWVGDLNEALDGIGRPFGFRVRQAMATYVANYPRTEDDNRYKLAFADQIEQKILPKLRGLDMGETACRATLNRIASLINALGDAPLEEAFRNSQQESMALGMFHWRGVTRPIDEDA